MKTYLRRHTLVQKSNDKWNYINEQEQVIFSDSLIFSYRPIIDDKAVFMIFGNEVEKRKRMHSEDRTGSQVFVEYLNQIKKQQLKEGLINTNRKIIIEPILSFELRSLDLFLIVDNF